MIFALKVFFSGLLIIFFGVPSFATCPSAENFKKGFEYLKQEPWSDLPMTFRLQTAHSISQGCVGSFERFRQVSLLLQKSGVDLKSTLNSALEFSALSDEQTQSFLETFKKIFLVEYFNFDFDSSFKLSLEFAKEPSASTKIMRQDFLELVQFCMKDRGVGLPIKTCANHAIEVVRSNRGAKDSIFEDWKSCYLFLKNDKRLGLSVKNAIDEIAGILRGGPGSCENFKSTFNYVTQTQGLELDPRAALDIAKSVSINSKEKSQDSKISPQGSLEVR
ncbi:MAG: hypothetical protein ACK5V3_03940 [Bdellovibrionales bacterium]